jgi:hypothetical protein
LELVLKTNAGDIELNTLTKKIHTLVSRAIDIRCQIRDIYHSVLKEYQVQFKTANAESKELFEQAQKWSLRRWAELEVRKLQITRDSLAKWVDRKKKEVSSEVAPLIDDMYNCMMGLSSLPPEFEEKRQYILTQIDAYRKNSKETVKDLMKRISPADNAIAQYTSANTAIPTSKSTTSQNTATSTAPTRSAASPHMYKPSVEVAGRLSIPPTAAIAVSARR